MSYSITLDINTLKSGNQENVIVLTDTTGGGSREVSVAVDYTDYYDRISTAIETIAANSTAILAQITSIANEITTIDDHLDTQGTFGNLASQITTMANEITTIDDHLDTQGTAGNLASKITTISEEITTIDDHLDTQGTAGNLASKITTISEEITTIDDHLDTQGTAGNLASKITTISEEITTIDDHLDTQGTLNNLARSIVNIDNHLDINHSDNLAGKISNIESHLNNYGTIYEITINPTAGDFLDNENITDNNLNRARILKFFEDKIIIDSLSSTFNGTTLLGAVSGATANIVNIRPLKSLSKEITEYLEKEDLYRIILKPKSNTVNKSITYNTSTISSPGNFSINENDVLKFISSNVSGTSSAENLYITRDPTPDDLESAAITDEGISGQGTRSITWNTTYQDRGTYYWFTESRSRSGTITVNYQGFSVDEKVKNSKGAIGFVKEYLEISEVDLRIIEVQSVENYFQIDDTITGEFNGVSAVIEDIINLNIYSSTRNTITNRISDSANPLGDAALYKLYVEEGEILKADNIISESQQIQAIKKVRELANRSGSL